GRRGCGRRSRRGTSRSREGDQHGAQGEASKEDQSKGDRQKHEGKGKSKVQDCLQNQRKKVENGCQVRQVEGQENQVCRWQEVLQAYVESVQGLLLHLNGLRVDGHAQGEEEQKDQVKEVDQVGAVEQ